MNARLVHADSWLGDGGGRTLAPLKYASVCGQQLFTMASRWPELARANKVTGVYQALGREKIILTQQTIAAVVSGGFDSLKPAALIFQSSAFGTFSHQAIALNAYGPFWTIEADEHAGSLALAQALLDLRKGRCAQALVGSYDTAGARSWLMLLEAVDGPGVRATTKYFGGGQKPSGDFATFDPKEDPHGCAAVAAAFAQAQSGAKAAVWSQTADGRGLLLSLEAKS